MVTEQYAHILDDDRRLNAQRFDDFFYQHQGAEPEMPHQTAQPIPENSAVDAERQQHLPNCWPTPLWPNSSKILQRTCKPLYINSDSFPYMEICRCLFYDDPVSLCFFALASSISIFS